MPAFRGARTAAVALVLVAAGVALAAPASAAPPVAVDDHKMMYAGQGRLIDVLRNDSDPDGDELAICRVGSYDEDRFYVDIEEDKLFVAAFENDSEDLVLTYYACDFDTLVPATLTVSFKEILPLKVVKAQRPGRIRMTNDNDRTVRVLYGDFRNERPDGRTRVFPHESVVVRVHRHKIDWIAFFARGSALVGIGHVRGIELPAAGRLSNSAATTFSNADLKKWAAQR